MREADSCGRSGEQSPALRPHLGLDLRQNPRLLAAVCEEPGGVGRQAHHRSAFHFSRFCRRRIRVRYRSIKHRFRTPRGSFCSVQESSKLGEFVTLDVRMEIMDLLYETKDTSLLFRTPYALAASTLVTTYAISVPKQQWEFPILPWGYIDCLMKTYGFLTPDFWRETRFTKSPFQEYTDFLAKPTNAILLDESEKVEA